ncbi:MULTISPECIES: DMT family transporter [Burkholderia]|uniref:DMT family transporter n=1 Tax=Burkholderia TaxID=32008 RepID=UPI000752F377|nr:MULTISPECIES: DMT family transporter [Burkholderia]AOJ70688.1 multidrug DMT transporter permease [Burkholderia savannae]AOJ82487.1 multidrug DMT transporter permease [Burkholderia savannae]KVG43793.1 multidrug DMT transporter permease [Burkholderia sp. MSMB0265]KVG88807.1 multidrug DMT transporter permease [Burkholderia sp. MSMB2040]KVG93187.1 multidrug DMT transporter permease [Burkholderia sp. MSMB2042]
MISYVGGLVLLAALLHASWNAILHGNRDRFLSMTWMSIGIAAVAIAFVAFLPAPAAPSWPYVVASGIVHIGYNLSLVYAYRRGDLGEAYPIARGSSPLLVTLGAALFAGERLGALHLIGIALVSAGIVSLAWQRSKVSYANAAAALMTGVTIALYTVIDGIGVRLSGNSVSYVAWTFVFYALMPAVFVAARGPRALSAPRIDIGSSVGGGIVSIVAYGIVVWAMQFGAMGAVSAIRETSVVFAVLIGRIFLNEQVTAKRFVSCVVIAAGAVCIGA